MARFMTLPHTCNIRSVYRTELILSRPRYISTERRGTSRNPAQKVAHPSGTNLQLAAETCEFCLFRGIWISILWINIIGQMISDLFAKYQFTQRSVKSWIRKTPSSYSLTVKVKIPLFMWRFSYEWLSKDTLFRQIYLPVIFYSQINQKDCTMGSWCSLASPRMANTRRDTAVWKSHLVYIPQLSHKPTTTS